MALGRLECPCAELTSSPSSRASAGRPRHPGPADRFGLPDSDFGAAPSISVIDGTAAPRRRWNHTELARNGGY